MIKSIFTSALFILLIATGTILNASTDLIALADSAGAPTSIESLSKSAQVPSKKTQEKKVFAELPIDTIYFPKPTFFGKVKKVSITTCKLTSKFGKQTESDCYLLKQYDFNAQGCIKSYRQYWNSGKPRILIEMDNKGRIIRNTNYSYDKTNQTEFSYNNNRLSSKLQSVYEGYSKSKPKKLYSNKFIFKYKTNKQGLPMERDELDNKMRLVTKVTFEYDEEGVLTKQIEYNKKGDPKLTKTVLADASFEICKSSGFGECCLEHWIFDKKGYLVERSLNNCVGNALVWKYNYTFNDNGNMLKEAYYNKYTGKSIQNMVYEYDDKGNWITNKFGDTIEKCSIKYIDN